MPLDVIIDQDALRVGPDFSVSFQRTLRIPDDGGEYPLPPGLGRFPLRRQSGDLLLPMYQREALWLSFEGRSWIPHAVKVGVGGIDALTGEPFDPAGLSPIRRTTSSAATSPGLTASTQATAISASSWPWRWAAA